MKIIFDNQAFINSLTPNVDELNSLTRQRNWAIGISAILVLTSAFFFYSAGQLKKELVAIKNIPPAETLN